MTGFDLIFDNGGGITLQTSDYCHFFHGSPKDAAKTVSELFESGAVPEYWEGNEPEHRVVHDREIERNGGYRWVSDYDVMEAVGQMPAEDRPEWLEKISGGAEREFFEVLFDLRDKASLQQ